MDIEDFLLPAPQIECETWQLGNFIKPDLHEGGVALIFCSEQRGARQEAQPHHFAKIRHELYRLSKQDWDFPIADLGDFISGKTSEDTHYALQELLLHCMKKKTIPLVIGGCNSLAYSLFVACQQLYKDLKYVQINPFLTLKNEGAEVSEDNFLAKIFEVEKNALGAYSHLGFLRHANNDDAVGLLNEVGFEVVRLAEMLKNSEEVEPHFRNADFISVNCDTVESFADGFSVHPQVNGLNRREICTYAKEAGLSENLKAMGIFNFNFASKNPLNFQLLAQMIWYFLEGISIRKSHPNEHQYENFWVMLGEEEVVFKRDTFRDLWYFGKGENISECSPCSKTDFELAKKGQLSKRLRRYL